MNLIQQASMAKRVGILTLDQTHSFTVQVLGNPTAQLSGIRVLDVSTGTWYNVYPEGQPAYCTPGAGNLVIAYGAYNIGAVPGIIYGRIVGPGGIEIHSGSQNVQPEGGVFWEPVFDMPTQNLSLTIEVGH